MVQPLTLGSSLPKSRAYFCHLRWRGRRRCIACSSRSLSRYGNDRDECRICKKRFSTFTGTYLDRMHLPWNDLSHLLYLFVLGVPVYRSDLYTTITMKTAYRYYTLFRQAIYDHSMREMETMQLDGEIELDEALFGGRRHGKRGWGAAGKAMVFGMYKRNGRVMCFPVPSRSSDELIPLVTAHSKPGSLYFTDDYHAYASLAIRGNHVVVRKKDGIPSGRDHINGIEGFWSYTKHWLYQYRGVPQHHFHLYLKEMEYRFNNRETNLFEPIAQLLVNPLR